MAGQTIQVSVLADTRGFSRAMAALGNDPAAKRSGDRADMLLNELCDLYLAEGCDDNKPSTIETNRSRIERHIKPLLGRKRVNSITDRSPPPNWPFSR